MIAYQQASSSPADALGPDAVGPIVRGHEASLALGHGLDEDVGVLLRKLPRLARRQEASKPHCVSVTLWHLPGRIAWTTRRTRS